MKCVCGGNRGDHTPDGCDCMSCYGKARDAQCTGYVKAAPTNAQKASKSDPAIAKNAKDTSVEAAILARPNAGTNMRACYDLVEASGERGMTPAEVEHALGKTHQTVSARMSELDKAGLIIDSGRRRRTPSGGTATVYVLMPETGFIAPTLALDLDDLEPEGAPPFDPRLVTVANVIAGKFGGDSRKHLATAKDLLRLLDLEPGAAPEYPQLPVAA